MLLRYGNFADISRVLTAVRLWNKGTARKLLYVRYSPKTSSTARVTTPFAACEILTLSRTKSFPITLRQVYVATVYAFTASKLYPFEISAVTRRASACYAGICSPLTVINSGTSLLYSEILF